MTAAELYAAMCRFAEDNGYHRRSPDEGGWWDHEEGCGRGDMTIGELVEEEFQRQKVDARLPPVAPFYGDEFEYDQTDNPATDEEHDG